jgi:hypothetical protein
MVKYWEIIADNLSKAGFDSGCVSAVDSNARTIFIADAHGGFKFWDADASPSFAMAAPRRQSATTISFFVLLFFAFVLVGSANVLFWCPSRFHQFDARSRQN